MGCRCVGRRVLECWCGGWFDFYLLLMVPPFKPLLHQFSLIPSPWSQYSWFHQTIPCTPSSVLLLLCACLNSLFNHTNFSTSHLIVCIFLALTQFFFLFLWSASSSWSKSWTSNNHVFHCTRWIYELSSIVFGSVKKNCCVLRVISPPLKCWSWGLLGSSRFCEWVFMNGGE